MAVSLGVTRVNALHICYLHCVNLLIQIYIHNTEHDVSCQDWPGE